MRGLIVAALVLGLGNQTVSSSLGPAPQEETGALSLAREFFRVWKTGKIDLLNSILSPRFVFEEPGNADLTGTEAYGDYVLSVFQGLSNYDFEVQEYFVKSSKVVALWSWTATHSGELMGLRATGRKFTHGGSMVLTVSNGRISHVIVHHNVAALLAQAGYEFDWLGEENGWVDYSDD